jgi:Rrf2 family protein
MRLGITRKATLAMRAMVLLARGDRLKATELAAALDATPAFVPQVIRPLVAAGWVGSSPGPVGGYALIVAPDLITVLDVIEAVDGPTDDGRCVVTDRPCGADASCVLHAAWVRARDDLVESLGRMPVSDVVGAP